MGYVDIYNIFLLMFSLYCLSIRPNLQGTRKRL